MKRKSKYRSKLEFRKKLARKIGADGFWSDDKGNFKGTTKPKPLGILRLMITQEGSRNE